MKGYFDHHGTTPLAPEARAAMGDALANAHGNPSSVHRAGRAARSLLERARSQLARACGAQPRELVFTSGGTEALHLAVRGVGEGSGVAAVLVDPGAHPALRAACEALAATRGVPLELLPSRAGGAPELERLATRLSALGGPALVALAWVQHETGAVAPMRELIDAARAHGALVVLDAVQALGKRPVDLGATGAAAAALSAHKIGGPAGVGAAWIAAGTRAGAVVTGGAQERGLRAGTENLVGAVGFGAAAEALPARLAAQARIAALRDRIEATLAALPDVVINGTERERVATVVHASLRGVAGEELVAALDLAGFCVSSGPACSSGRPGPSGTMLALYPEEPWRARSALRISLGQETREDDVAALCDALPRVIARVRDAGE